MRKTTRIGLLLSLLVAAAFIVAGCGGGGGGGGGTTPPTPPVTGFTITGTILEQNTNKPVTGAVVTIGSYSSTSDSQGRVSFNMTAAPSVTTYSVDLTNARVSINNVSTPVYTWWIKANTVVQNPAAVGLPSNMTSPGTLGTLYTYAIADEYPPPGPVIP